MTEQKVMALEGMTRTQMEIAILENEIADVNTEEGLEKIEAMTDEEMRSTIEAWVEEGDELA